MYRKAQTNESTNLAPPIRACFEQTRRIVFAIGSQSGQFGSWHQLGASGRKKGINQEGSYVLK